MQMEEESNPNLIEMKDRIQKYKYELRKPSTVEEKENQNKTGMDTNNINAIPKGKNRASVYSANKKKKEEQENLKDKEIDKKEEDKNIEEDEKYEDDYNYDIYDENDPKAKKMKKAMARFRNKYKDIIIENKKNLKMKEKEEKEKEEAEKKELEGYNEVDKEKEEREKKEKEEKERLEKERKEKERKEREEKERKEKERKEKERKERERKDREEKERREKEERERKEKDKKIGQNKLQPNNFAKMLADKMKFGPMGGGGLRKASGGIDYNSKPSIIVEKKVDVVNLIEGQPFKRKTKRKPTRKTFMD